MAQVQNLNQFQMTPMKGQQDLTVNNNIKAARINPAYVGALPLVAGQVMKIVDAAGEIPIVEPAAVTETGYGVLLHNLRKDTFLAGDYVDLACKGSVVWLEASAAIAGGAKVQNTPTTDPNVQTLTSLATNCQVGLNLTKIAAAGMVRIELDFQDPNLSAY